MYVVDKSLRDMGRHANPAEVAAESTAKIMEREVLEIFPKNCSQRGH